MHPNVGTSRTTFSFDPMKLENCIIKMDTMVWSNNGESFTYVGGGLKDIELILFCLFVPYKEDNEESWSTLVPIILKNTHLHLVFLLLD